MPRSLRIACLSAKSTTQILLIMCYNSAFFGNSLTHCEIWLWFLCGNFKTSEWFIFWIFDYILPCYECQKISSIVIQHWFGWCVGTVRQQAITLTSVDLDLRRLLESLGHNELTILSSFIMNIGSSPFIPKYISIDLIMANINSIEVFSRVRW